MVDLYENLSFQKRSSADIKVCIRITIASLRKEREFFNRSNLLFGSEKARG
jgi:hypothetical protein